MTTFAHAAVTASASAEHTLSGAPSRAANLVSAALASVTDRGSATASINRTPSRRPRRRPSRATGRATHRPAARVGVERRARGRLHGHTYRDAADARWHETRRRGTTRELPLVTLFDVEGDKISSHRAHWDVATVMAQLGLMRSTK